MRRRILGQGRSCSITIGELGDAGKQAKGGGDLHSRRLGSRKVWKGTKGCKVI